MSPRFAPRCPLPPKPPKRTRSTPDKRFAQLHGLKGEEAPKEELVLVEHRRVLADKRVHDRWGRDDADLALVEDLLQGARVVVCVTVGDDDRVDHARGNAVLLEQRAAVQRRIDHDSSAVDPEDKAAEARREGVSERRTSTRERCASAIFQLSRERGGLCLCQRSQLYSERAPELDHAVDE